MLPLALLSIAAVALAPSAADTAVAISAPTPPAVVAVDPRLAPPAADTTRPRRRSVEVSEWYARRLTIHRIGSYTMLPLFGAQYLLGDRLLDQRERASRGAGAGVSDGVRNAHIATAIGVGTLFGVNTVTGLWNLHDSRGQQRGRTRRTIHAALMLASDAGFAATGLIAGKATDGGLDDARRHRNVALASMVPATIGAVMMWLPHE